MTIVELVIGLSIGLLVMWIGLLLLLLLLVPHGVDLAEAKQFVPDVVRLVRDLAKDKSLGGGVRGRLLLLLAYLASPLDLVPDFVPVLGYVDDVIIVAAVLRSVIRRAGPDALDQRWRGTTQGLAVVRRLTGADGT